ncbi:MAG: radical SAM protein [Saprospiraceae bacterium]|nr:radical SAM protein [Saprospiraceae bacterium]
MLYKNISAPITCQVEITSQCNCNCLYCYNYWRHSDEIVNYRMTNETLDKVLSELIKNKVFHITFTGGEPLLNKAVLFKGVETVLKNSMGCTVNSNLNGFKFEDGLTLYKSGLRGILTSVSSYNSSTHDLIMQTNGSHSKVMAGIDNALKSGLKVACSMVVTKLNKDDVIETGKFLMERGVSTFYATSASPPLNSKGFEKYMLSNEDLVQVLEDLKFLEIEYGYNVGILQCYPLCSYQDGSKFQFASSKRCSAGTTGCTIAANGDIRPCTHSDEIYGNIKDGLSEIWSKMDDYRDGSKIPSECQSCSFLADCSAGCRVDAKYVNGTDNSLDPYARPSKTNLIKRNEVILPHIDNSDTFYVNQELNSRHEEIGVLLDDKYNRGIPVLLTHDTYDLLNQLGQNNFSIQTIQDLSGLSINESSNLCALLYKDKVIKRN